MEPKAGVTAIAVTLLCTVALAQAPRREPPVKIPGTDLVLEEGWRLVYTSGTGYRCMYAVPSSWAVSPHGWKAVEPGGIGLIEMSTFETAQWTSARRAVQAAMRSAIVQESTTRRFRAEDADESRIWQHIAENDGAHVCAADVETRRTDRIHQIVDRIAVTVHVSHESNLTWTKPR